MNEVTGKEFTHLKIHTQYSICEGALRTSDLAKYCKTNKIKAVGLCDSNNLCGIKNDEEPHCKIEDIEKDHKGLILLTGSLDGLIGKLFFKNLTDEIYLLFKRLSGVFKNNLYIEIQRHGDEGEKIFEGFLVNSAKKLNLPIIATHEVFYLDQDMHEAHDAFVCIGEKTYVNSKDRKKYSDSHFLKSSDEMFKVFHDLPDALENNINFPMRISYRPKNSLPILPNIQTEKIKDVDELLIKESTEGLNEKLKEYVFSEIENKNLSKTKEIYNNRLNHEINIISKMKYSSYFLIVSDYIKWAKKNDIPVGPGRGSGAGSLVAWALSITDIDPIKFDLIFERF